MSFVARLLPFQFTQIGSFEISFLPGTFESLMMAKDSAAQCHKPLPALDFLSVIG